MVVEGNRTRGAQRGLPPDSKKLSMLLNEMLEDVNPDEADLGPINATLAKLAKTNSRGNYKIEIDQPEYVCHFKVASKMQYLRSKNDGKSSETKDSSRRLRSH